MSQIDAGRLDGNGYRDDAPRVEEGFDSRVTEQPAPADHGEGPVMTDEEYQAYLDGLARHPLLTDENIRLRAESVRGLRSACFAVGLLGLAATLLGAFAVNPAHALASFEVGVFTVLAMCLGSLFFVMTLAITNSYWATTLRRQFENVASLVWLPVLGMIIVAIVEIVSGGVLLTWMKGYYEGNYILEKKRAFLNIGFFGLSTIVYAGVWIFLAQSIAKLSRDQDTSGDRWLTRLVRARSGWGLPLFALTTAFAAFHYLMSLDFRFFSTMWGVYFFAGAAMSSMAVVAVIAGSLRLVGKLNGVVTKEHSHDLGKLLFAFTVFWAYIGFSQYFLIWYSNIPEETAYFLYRKEGGWEVLSFILAAGHFVVPFFILISRKTKRNFLGILGAYMLLMQVLDMVYVIRPMVYVGKDWAPTGASPINWWLDVAAVVGVLGLFAALLLGKMTDGPLIPIKDPRLGKALKHKNYV